MSRVKERDKGFMQGYMCACAVMLSEHGEDTMVEDCVRGNFKSIQDLMKHKVDQHDIEILEPIFKEIERKRNLLTNQTK